MACKWCISAVQIVNAFLKYNTFTYLAASLRLFLDASEALPANGGSCKDQIDAVTNPTTHVCVLFYTSPPDESIPQQICKRSHRLDYSILIISVAMVQK